MIKHLPSWVVGLFHREHEYHINGVTYLVNARFEPSKEGRSIQTVFQRIISGDMVDLLDCPPRDTIAAEYVCSAVREEDQ